MFLEGKLQHLYSISYMLIMLWSAARHTCSSAALSLEFVVFCRRSRARDLVTSHSREPLNSIPCLHLLALHKEGPGLENYDQPFNRKWSNS